MNKSTWIALLVFAGLAAAAVVSLREKPERGITRISFAEVVPARVDRLVIKDKDKGEVELKRDGGEWKIDGKRADGEAVDRLLDVIHGVNSSELETSNAERFAEMEVDDAKGASVQVYSGGHEVANFVVGGAGAAGSHVRVGESVYAVRGLYRASLTRDRSGWVEKRLFFDAPDDVTRVEVALSGAAPYALVKDAATWKPEDTAALAGKRFDGNAAATLVRSLVSARAAEVLDSDPGEAAGLAASTDVLRYTTAAGETRTLTLGAAQDDGSVYARSSAREPVVTLRKGTAESLRKPLRALRDLALMSFDIGAARKLEIAGPHGDVVFEHEGEGWALANASEAPGDDFVLDEGAVRRRVSALASIKGVAEASADTPGVAQLDASPQHVAVTLQDGSVVTLRFGDEAKWQEEDVVLARGNAEPEVFFVRKPARDQLLGGLETFRRRDDAGENPLGNIDPQALQNLPPEVRESLLKQIQEKAQRDAMMKKAMEAAQ